MIITSHTLPNPPELVRLFERGELSREEFHCAMALHARSLIAEMEEAQRNPIAAYVETVRNRTAARRLIRNHGEAVIREALAAMAETPDFQPSNLLWNVCHWDVPLHCFLRTRREPVFRILRFEAKRLTAKVLIEHGPARRGEGKREEFTFTRNWKGHFVVESRVTK